MIVKGYRVGPLLKKTAREVMDDNVLGLAAQSAYYFFFSLFPIFLFLAPLLALVGDKRKVFTFLLEQVGRAVPAEAFALVRNVVQQVVFEPSAPGLVSIGALLAAWSGSGVFSNLMDALNAAYDCDKDSRPWWKKKLIALASVIVIGMVILVSTMLILGGDTAADFIADKFAWGATARTAAKLLPIPIAFALLITIAALAYYFLPNLRQSKRQVFVGAIFTTIAWTIVTFAFRAYVTNFANYNATYGAIGGVIVLLTWMYFSMLVFLIGGEINAEIHEGTGAVAPRPGLMYGGRIETGAAAGVSSLERIERIEPLGARRT